MDTSQISAPPHTPQQTGSSSSSLLNKNNHKKNSVYVLDQDASIIIHQHHFDVNQYKLNAERRGVYENLQQLPQPTVMSNRKMFTYSNQNLYECEDEKQPLSPTSQRTIRFDDSNTKVYDFLPSQVLRPPVKQHYYVETGKELVSYPDNQYAPTRHTLNSSYMSNNSSSASVARASSSSSTSSSVFLDRKDSARIGLHYLNSSMGYSTLGNARSKKRKR